MTFRTLSNGLVQIVKWADRKHADENPWHFYQEYYNGIAAGELMVVDPGLSRELYRSGLDHRLPPSKNKRGRKPRFPNPSETYNQSFAGHDRRQLRKECMTLYNAMCADGSISEVPKPV